MAKKGKKTQEVQRCPRCGGAGFMLKIVRTGQLVRLDIRLNGKTKVEEVRCPAC